MKSLRLQAELDEERERHAFTSARLQELQKKQSDTLEQAYMLQRDLEHVATSLPDPD